MTHAIFFYTILPLLRIIPAQLYRPCVIQGKTKNIPYSKTYNTLDFFLINAL